MSVEAPKVVEETPVVKPVVASEPVEAPPAAAATTETTAPAVEPAAEAAAEAPAGEETVAVVAVPASEGVLGYKAPGFLKQFHFSKNFFWFSEEAASTETLKKIEIPHSHAAWAQETKEGVLYYTKRAEDKAHPAGLILLSEATNVLKEGAAEFQFTIGKKVHRFEAANTAERDSWIVAIESAIEESKKLEEEITGRESYKKTLETFAVAPTATKAERSSSKGPSKAIETPAPAAAAAATDSTTAEPVVAEPVAEPVVAESDKAEKKAEKEAKKERSQSRKRNSIFGFLGQKEEDKEAKEAKKAEKEAEKAAKEAEKEQKKAQAEKLKEEKKVEAEAAKEEAQATHEPSTVVEAAEAAAIAAAPVAVVAGAEERKEEKEEKAAETTPTEKKNKRASVFGGLFSKKVTSPTTEKTEKEAVADAPVADSEIPPVSETAPKLDEPIENKPIDTAAVTAPADTVETPAVDAAPVAAVEEPVKETPAAEITTPKTEKKGGFLGFMKKSEAKKETKEDKATEEIAKDPVAAAATTEPAVESVAEPATTETPVAADATKDERATREKRRSSFFGSLGTIKKKAAPESSETEGEVKRERSPLPSKFGSMFRKSSRGVKPTEAEAAATETEAINTDAAETPANATVPESTDSKIVGDVVPADLTVHDAVTTAPSEVKASA